MRQEISRCASATADGPSGKTVSDKLIVASLRRWFFARKPDAGFALSDFPATLLQARMFDEWLDARDENLDAVVVPDGADESVALVAGHYRTLGLVNDETVEIFAHA